MSLIVFVPASGYDISEAGVINAGGGIAFDVHAALVAGGGTITIDDVATPSLANALKGFKGLMVSGTTPGTPATADIIGPVLAHSKRADGSGEQAGDGLVRGADGLFAPAPNSGLPLSVVSDSPGVNAPLVDGAANQLVNIPAWQAATLYPAGYCIQQGGLIYARVALGTSGASFAADAANWTALTAAGVELGYAEITAAPANLTTAEADVSGLSITFTAPARPVALHFYCWGFQQFVAAGIPWIKIADPSNNYYGQGGAGTVAINAFSGALNVWRRLAAGVLTAGTSYTFKVRGLTSGASAQAQMDCGPTYPAFLRAEQL